MQLLLLFDIDLYYVSKMYKCSVLTHALFKSIFFFSALMKLMHECVASENCSSKFLELVMKVISNYIVIS